MIRRFLAGMALAFLASAALAQGDPGQYFPGGQLPAEPGLEIATFSSFSVGYDPSIGEPRWSAQHETAASIAAGAKVKRNGDFHVCVFADGSKSVSPTLYAKSGFDLGHQTEDAGRVDRPPTFGTCNMSPQRPNLNRIIWAGIEQAVRDLATQDGDIYVVTGPLIPDAPQMLGGKVAVPSHSWKAVYDVKTNASGAYLCQNTDMPTCSEESVAALAGQIGFDPLPGLPDAVKAQAMRLPQPAKGGQLTN